MKPTLTKLQQQVAVSEAWAAKWGRSCGDCDLCCRVIGVSELKKPAYTACEHAKGGCAVHAVRPESCHVFFCAWRFGIGDDRHRPDQAGFLIAPPNDRNFTWQVMREAGSKPFLPEEWPELVDQMQARCDALWMPFAMEIHDPDRPGQAMIHATPEWTAKYGDKRQRLEAT